MHSGSSKKSRLHRRLLKGMIGICVLCGLLGAAVVLSRPPLLLQRATRVWNVAGSQPIYLWRFTWLSQNDVFLVEQSDNLDMQIEQANIKTRATKQLPALAKQMHWRAPEWIVSPDQRHVLWIAHAVPTNWNTTWLQGAEIDGSHSFTIKPNNGHMGRIFWLSDSRHWIEFKPHDPPEFIMPDNTLQAQIFSVDAPQESHSQPVSFSMPVNTTALNTFDYSTMQRIGENRLMWYQALGDSQPIRKVLITDIALRPGRGSARTFTIKPPPNTTISEMCFSPGGDRIAWLVVEDGVNPLLSWLHRFLPVFRLKPTTAVSVWVSQLDGSRMHEIGRLPGFHEPAVNEEPPSMPDDLQWIPGGTRLSFIFNGGLYTIAAD